MSQAYFLIPGLLLPQQAFERLSASTLSALEQLTLGQTAEVMSQTLSSGVFTRAVHDMWVWRVLCSRPSFPPIAPYVWHTELELVFASEVWRLDIGTRTADGIRALPDAALTDDLIETICARLLKPLASEGFTLQRWDKTLYLTRRNNWPVATRPWSTLTVGHRPDERDIEPAPGAQPDSVLAAQAALNRLQTALCTPEAPVTASGHKADALWIWGGGRGGLIFPPTKIRGVLADETAIISWTQNAGLFSHCTAKAAGAADWPEQCAPGTRLAVLSDLYEPWLHADWPEWEKRSPALCEQIRTLMAAAAKKECKHSLIIACGERLSSTVTLQAASSGGVRGLLERLKRQHCIAPDKWLIEGSLA
jgi:hypothetical protein